MCKFAKVLLCLCCLCFGLAGFPQANVPSGIPAKISVETSLEALLNQDPPLAVLREELAVAEGQILQSDQSINPVLETEMENIAGTGPYEGLDGAEITVSYSQVLETGGKRQKRRNLAEQASSIIRRSILLREREIEKNLREAVTDILLVRAEISLMEDQQTLAEETVKETQRLVDAARSSQVDLRRAQLAVGQQQFGLQQTRGKLASARTRVAVLWGASGSDAFIVLGELKIPAGLPPLTPYVEQLDTHPQLGQFEDRKRQEEARLALEKAQGKGDVEVFGGVRYSHEEEGSHAFLVGVGIPLPLFDRNRGNIASAEAEIRKVTAEAVATRREMFAELNMAYAEMSAAHLELLQLETSLLPLAEQTLAESLTAYERGQFSLLEVLDSRQALFEIRESRLDALRRFTSAQSKIDNLTPTRLSLSQNKL